MLTRARSVRVAIGELDATRLYDLRAFKTCWAELAYLHRLAAGGRHGGTVVTSMRQLVAGIAPLHPTWKLTGDPWEDRDRHHQSVRRRLSALAAAGLLRWRIGLDEDLEERRTELELLPVPELLPDELTQAAERLERWEMRYGPALNTHSAIGITDVKQTAAPLGASERQRRGCRRARQAAHAKRVRAASQTISSPPFGTPPTSENNFKQLAIISDAQGNPLACGSRTSVTRMSAAPTALAWAAVSVVEKTAHREGDAGPAGGLGRFDVDGLLLRVEARRREREPVLALISGHVERRATEVWGWGLGRGWPVGRLREAWVAARFGPGIAAEFGSSVAGPLGAEDYARLRRAVARFERNAPARPEGFPAGGLAALMHIGVLAAAGGGGPRRVCYAIGALDQLSRRMRAVHTRGDPGRTERAVRLAHGRHGGDVAGRASYRAGAPRLPRWIKVDPAGVPLVVDGVLQVDEAWQPPGRHTIEYRTIARDAYLLAIGGVPGELDGRAEMAQHARGLPGAGDHRAPLGPYPRASQPDGDRPGRELLELAHRTGMTLDQAKRVAPDIRAAILARARAQDDTAIRADALESNESRRHRYEEFQRQVLPQAQR